MQAAHHTAALARLRAHTMLADKTDSGIRFSDNGAPVRANYISVITTLPGYEESRLTSEQTPAGDAPLFVRIRVVAVDYDGLLQLLDASDAQLVGHHLIVTGRAVTGFERELDEPRYDPISRLWHVDVMYEATSSRAVA